MSESVIISKGGKSFKAEVNAQSLAPHDWIIQGKLTVPTVDSSGIFLGTSIGSSSNNNFPQAAWKSLFWGSACVMFEEIEVPSHFEYVKFIPELSGTDYTAYYKLKKLYVLGSGTLDLQNDYPSIPFEEIVFNGTRINSGGTGLRSSGAGKASTHSLKITAPNLLTFNKYILLLSDPGHGIELILDMPSLTDFMNTGGVGGRIGYWTGSNVLPSVHKFGNLDIPYYGDQTWRLPMADEGQDTQAYNHDGTYVCHIYLGPYVSSIRGGANWATYSSSFDIHIPAGDSTTKNTLDALSVTYTQDYDWEADLA